MVDALYVIQEKDQSISGLWTKAEIVEILDDSKLVIKIVSNSLRIEVNISDKSIFPEGTFSKVHEWRTELKIDDLVDVYQNNIWILCKITEITKTKIAKFTPVHLQCPQIAGTELFPLSIYSPYLRKPNQFSKSISDNELVSYISFPNEKFNLIETVFEVSFI